MTTPNIRAVLQKLLNEVHELRLEAGNPSLRSAIIEARAALAAEPEPPADGEVAELVAALRADAECAEVEHCDLCNMTADQMRRAADLLERLAPQPMPVRPTNEELWKLEDDMGGSPEDSLWCRKYARAVLARWGQP